MFASMQLSPEMLNLPTKTIRESLMRRTPRSISGYNMSWLMS